MCMEVGMVDHELAGNDLRDPLNIIIFLVTLMIMLPATYIIGIGIIACYSFTLLVVFWLKA